MFVPSLDIFFCLVSLLNSVSLSRRFFFCLCISIEEGSARHRFVSLSFWSGFLHLGKTHRGPESLILRRMKMWRIEGQVQEWSDFYWHLVRPHQTIYCCQQMRCRKYWMWLLWSRRSTLDCSMRWSDCCINDHDISKINRFQIRQASLHLKQQPIPALRLFATAQLIFLTTKQALSLRSINFMNKILRCKTDSVLSVEKWRLCVGNPPEWWSASATFSPFCLFAPRSFFAIMFMRRNWLVLLKISSLLWIT